MEQILIHHLPQGTRVALTRRGGEKQRSAEDEAREILIEVLGQSPLRLVDLLSTDEGADIESEPERLGRRIRTPAL